MLNLEPSFLFIFSTDKGSGLTKVDENEFARKNTKYIISLFHLLFYFRFVDNVFSRYFIKSCLVQHV